MIKNKIIKQQIYIFHNVYLFLTFDDLAFSHICFRLITNAPFAFRYNKVSFVLYAFAKKSLYFDYPWFDSVIQAGHYYLVNFMCLLLFLVIIDKLLRCIAHLTLIIGIEAI